ncbi:type VI secretion system membrane subunit TssM [Albimonas pacifica]|uniref:Type VI secretion system protein ImpL n=1 Tax=Albimonas pacifica TaxID=1114924 RepID=A0A1I3CZT8_9RHOB|nr:type VI secretion system membrane subunit TssM [Albimonas pacifica]SFH79985.1 type VI secretion system protein ImpL [Albimonas pacifica]
MILNRIRALFDPAILALVLFGAILGAAIWFMGPLLAIGEARPFDGLWGRLVAIGALAAFVVIACLAILLRRRGRDRAMTRAIVEEVADPEDAAAAAELDELRARMAEALGVLRGRGMRGRFGARRLFQLPWYVIIGPPGAGKTTAIVNSGLHFPLAERMGKTALGGVGGTRNCDWWFTDEAVLLDTAGRYTTQESGGEADAKAWTGFLDLLKKHRGRQPINGALAAISLSDLAVQSEAERRDHARAVRNRLAELRERLGVSFPVYVIFTKADRIAGFQEFFEDLGAAEREQVWGFTLPYEKKPRGAPLAGFGAEFEALLERLENRSLERMQAESDPQRRALVQGFPSQVASLRGAAEGFLSDVFRDSRYEARQLLRGVYFTSGTQEGAPIDRLMAGMARTFGISRQAVGSGAGQGRSYFLTRLLTGVVFPEAGLVSADDRVERRYRWTRRGAAAAGVLALAGACAAWTVSYRANAALIAGAQDRAAQFRELAARIPGSPVGDDDLASVLPALDLLLGLPGNPAAGDPEPPVEETFGLYQGDAVGTESAQAYRAALNALLLPRLLYRLETQMQASLNDPELLFEALKVYLMLGLQGPMAPEIVRRWMRVDWAVALPGEEAAQASLALHLDRMLAQPMREIALNGPLVDQVRGLLSETPLAERVYRSIVGSPEARDLPAFRLTEAGGPAASRVLLRPSGKPLSEGVEGVYTRAAFHRLVLPEVLSIAARVRDEAWVLGPRGEVETSPAGLARIGRDVLGLYYTDYVSRYDGLLADIDVVPVESLSHATEVVNVLSGPTSPLVAILEAVARETRLSRPPPEAGVAGAAVGAAGAAADLARTEAVSALDARGQALFDAISAASPGAGEAVPERPGQFVEDRFAALHAFVEAPQGAPSELDGVVASLTEVYRELNRLSLGQDTGTALAGQGGGAAARLQERIGRLPAPMDRWASQVASASSGVAVGGARAELNALWQAQVHPFCSRALEGRYPFDRSAAADVALQDFGRLFGPQGLIDGFFQEHLLPFVDAAASPWRWKRVNDVDLGISDAVLAQFQKAAEIRDSFFLAPGQPAITFDLTPVALDPNVQQVVVEIEGQEVSYAHGPPEVTPLKWPGAAGGRTRVAMSPAQAGIENTLSREGPWAWFRLLDAAELRRTNVTDRNRVIFNIGGRIAIFQLRAGSALNPFSGSAVRGFRCPSSL